MTRHKKLLKWVYRWFVRQYKENPNVSIMQELKTVLDEYDPDITAPKVIKYIHVSYLPYTETRWNIHEKTFIYSGYDVSVGSLFTYSRFTIFDVFVNDQRANLDDIVKSGDKVLIKSTEEITIHE